MLVKGELRGTLFAFFSFGRGGSVSLGASVPLASSSGENSVLTELKTGGRKVLAGRSVTMQAENSSSLVGADSSTVKARGFESIQVLQSTYP